MFLYTWNKPDKGSEWETKITRLPIRKLKQPIHSLEKEQMTGLGITRLLISKSQTYCFGKPD